MLNELKSKYSCRSSARAVYAFINAHNENELDMDAPYQRDYVWTEKEQQRLLESFLSGLPLSAIAITTSNRADRHMIVVDGKQRLTTLILFFENKIPFIYKGKEFFAKDFEDSDLRNLKKQTIPVSEIYNHDGSDVPVSAQVDFFLRVNFYGVPQSDEHRKKVMSMKSEVDDKE